MTVRFLCYDPDPAIVDVEYGVPSDARVPVVNEYVVADGEDVAFAEGRYLVERVEWLYGIRGPRAATVTLARLEP